MSRSMRYVSRRNTIIVLGFILLVVLVIFGGAKLLEMLGIIDPKGDLLARHRQMVADAVDEVNSKNLNIICYGEELKAPDGLKYTMIYSLTAESINTAISGASWKKAVLLINDPNGHALVSDGAWKTVSDTIKNNDIIFIYLGTAKLKNMANANIISSGDIKDIKSVIIWKKNGGVNMEPGFCDSITLIPEMIKDEITKDQWPIYSAVMKLSDESKYF